MTRSEQRAHATARRLGAVARDTALTIAAVIGVIGIVCTIVAMIGGYSLVLFKTGSMGPVIPAGSIAVVQKVPADALAVGDVVTVDRAGALPVTHRVTGITTAPATAARTLTLRGDANDVDDPMPYVVSEVRILRAAVPGGAEVLVWFGDPRVLGALTLGLTGVVTWAFWPRGRRSGAAAPGAAPDSASGSAPGPSAPLDSALRGFAPRERATALWGIAGAVVLVVAMTTPSPSASAAVNDPLELRSSLTAEVHDLDPVEPLLWLVDVDASHAPADGQLDIALRGAGDPALGLTAEVSACASPWADGTCRDPVSLLAETRVALDEDYALWSSGTPDLVFLQISVTVQPDAGAAPGPVSLTVRATAGGETADVDLDGDSPLPATGGVPAGMLAAPAALAAGLGIALLARQRRRTRNCR